MNKTIEQTKPEWFEGTWSRYRPKKGKDKRGTMESETTIIN